MQSAEKNNVACYNVLTGFKWIAELIKEKEGKENYIIGGEEKLWFDGRRASRGMRKDAISAVALFM